MTTEIKVRIIDGCPGRVIAETEEDRELADRVLGNIECGCVVEVEGAAEAAKAEVDETEAAEAARAEVEAAEAVDASIAAEAAEQTGKAKRRFTVCSLEPEKPWEESVCGVVAEEAADLAVAKVLAQLREEGLIT